MHRNATHPSSKTIHFILTVSDNGTPSLTAYRRIVIEVR